METKLITMTCEELRQAFEDCKKDENKRILIIDVRNAESFNRSHLCLDRRIETSNPFVARQFRVLNIDPQIVRPTTVKKIQEHLTGRDLDVFNFRSKASDVVIIDYDTDNMVELAKPNSRVMCIIRGLKNLDTNERDKINVPIKVLEGGYMAWYEQYKTFTKDSTFGLDNNNHHNDKAKAYSLSIPPRDPETNIIINNLQPKPLTPVLPPQVIIQPTLPSSKPTPLIPQAQPSRQPPITKPVPIPPKPQPSAPRLDMSRNAPGTAVPATPSLSIRSALPRSHSSPNVAQADDSGDDLDNISNHVNNLNFPQSATNHRNGINLNNNHLTPTTTSENFFKPIFDRSLKPSYNPDLVRAIRAHLDFGDPYAVLGKTQTGLHNLGNTCFMNSVIQCLAYTPALVSYFCSDYYGHINFNTKDGSRGELAIEFGALIEKVALRKYKYIEPKSFHVAIKKHFGFADREQQDSHEFMMMLFDRLHHDLNRHVKDKSKQNGINPIDSSGNNYNGNIHALKTNPEDKLDVFWREHLKQNKSIISELFEGLFMSTVTCTYCNTHSDTYEVFNCLSLPISANKSTIRECLTHFSNPERIDAAWKCDTCEQTREVVKKIVIRKLPRILIIHLKRFSLDGRWRQKLETRIEFPLQDLILPSTPARDSYHLYAVINHYGDLNGGHYTASCQLENQQWYTFSDRDVSRIDSSSVCSQAAYILFYVAK